MKTLLFLCLVCPAICFGQMTKRDSLWLPFQNFIGEWTGTSEGQPGSGKYERSYRFLFDKRFIEVKNKSIYPPSQNHPKGEVHEDIGYISYDRTRKTFLLRQFHTEGFVIQYILESISPDGKAIVFLSDAIENIPAGWKAKETYQIGSEKEFTELFELSEPGKPFEMYSKASLRKSK